jgi:hypothetical protein
LALGDDIKRLSKYPTKRLKRSHHRRVLRQLGVILVARKCFVENVNAALDVMAILLILVNRVGRLLDLERNSDNLHYAAHCIDHLDLSAARTKLNE